MKEMDIYKVSDESFEVDLDENFNQALSVLLQLGIPSINRYNFLIRPKNS